MSIKDPDRYGLIGLVGPCAAGKTTISRLLKEEGFQCRVIAQEHSYVPSMWRQITNPSLLIFLDASYGETKTRKLLDWNLGEYEEQQHRLRDARFHADFYILTDSFTPFEVASKIMNFIKVSSCV